MQNEDDLRGLAKVTAYKSVVYTGTGFERYYQ